METKSTHKSKGPVTEIIKTAWNDQIVRIIIIGGGIITLIFLSGIVFKVVAATLVQFKSMQAAYRM